MAGSLQLRPVAGGHEEFTARIDDVELSDLPPGST